MDPTNLREVFAPNGSGGRGDDGSSRSQDDILAEMKSVARNGFGGLLDELKALPQVAREGVSPHKARPLVDLLMEQAMDVEQLGRKGADYLHASDEDQPEGAEVPA